MNEEEYGKIRTVPEFIDWVKHHPDETDHRNVWTKKFYQEAWPLMHFLMQKTLPPNTKISLDTTEDSFDALLLSEPDVAMKFQIVSTDSEESVLMDEDLEKHGMTWLPISAPTKPYLRKMNKEDVEAAMEEDVRSKHQIVREKIAQIVDRINRKISKKYADELYLLVSFNDYFLMNMPGDEIKKIVSKKMLPNDSFIKIYLVSEHKLIEL